MTDGTPGTGDRQAVPATNDDGRLPRAAREALEAAYRAYADAPARSAEQKRWSAEISALAAAGRAAGWPMRLLAQVCGVSAERMRQFAAGRLRDLPPEAKALFPQYKRPRPAARKAVERAHLSVDEAAELRELAKLAGQNTGSHAADSPAAQASRRFTALVRGHHDRGVIWAEISDATRMWTAWPLTEGETGLEPLVRVSGLRQRIARAQ